jgi:hypothetical protein
VSFDRIKPPEDRLLRRAGGQRLSDPDADPAGRAALFSASSPASTPAGLRLHCSRCGEWSALDAATALRAAVPLFLVAPWRDYPLFAVCPAGRHRAWLRLSGPP